MGSVPQLGVRTCVRKLRRTSLLAGLAAVLGLTGCGIGTVTTTTTPAITLTGEVHGGMQPVTGATVQLYAAGATGNGSAATPLLANPVITDGKSTFVITSAITCPAATTPVYLVARGGNPGFSANVNNPALVLVAALGTCGNLASGGMNVHVNEVTTVAAAYALAQFTSAYDHIGASATNTTGIANAFADAKLLADPSTGLAATLPSNLTTETGKLYALADAIVPCVNSDGGRACTPLFTAATVNGIAPTDVLTALINIVKHPGTNVAAVFGAIPSTPPFATTLTAPPTDWTMSLRITGGGILEPTGLGIDGAGNVWVTNFGDKGLQKPAGVAAYSPQGTPFSTSLFGAGLQTDAYGLAVDKNGDIWVPSYDNNGSGSVAKFLGAESSTPGTLVAQYQDSSLDFPESISSDPSGTGHIFLGNYLSGTATVFGLNGQVTSVLGANLPPASRSAFPISITADGAGGAWLGGQGDAYVTHFLSDGTSVKADCCTGAQAVSLDLHGNVWAASYFGLGDPSVYTFSEVASDGTVLIHEQQGGGTFVPHAGTVDAGGQFWILDHTSINTGSFDTLTEIAGNDSGLTPGTPLSPSTGFGAGAHMTGGYSLAPDASGNLWITDRQDSSLRMFFGLATPTRTPSTPIPQAP